MYSPAKQPAMPTKIRAVRGYPKLQFNTIFTFIALVLVSFRTIFPAATSVVHESPADGILPGNSANSSYHPRPLPKVCISTVLHYGDQPEIMRAQLRAVESWSNISPMPLIFSCVEPEYYIKLDMIFGHLRNVFLVKNCDMTLGMFRLDNVFSQLKEEASNNACPILMHINSGLIIDSGGFIDVLSHVQTSGLLHSPFLIVGERTGLDLLLHERNVEDIIKLSIVSNAATTGEWCIDYFIYSALTFPYLPPLLLDSPMMDNWLLQNARGPRIDASSIMKAVHINQNNRGLSPALSEIADVTIWNKIHTGGIDFWVAGTLQFVDFRLQRDEASPFALVRVTQYAQRTFSGWKNFASGIIAERRKSFAGQAASFLPVGVSLSRPNFLVMFPDENANIVELLHDDQLLDQSEQVRELLEFKCGSFSKLIVFISTQSPYLPMLAISLGCRVVVFEPDENARYCLRSSIVLNNFDLSLLTVVPGRPGGVASNMFLGSVIHEDVHLIMVDSPNSQVLADALPGISELSKLHKVENILFDASHSSLTSKPLKWLERVRQSKFWSIQEYELHSKQRRRSRWFLLRSSAAWRALPNFFAEASSVSSSHALNQTIASGLFCAAFQSAPHVLQELQRRAEDDCARFPNVTCIFSEGTDLKGLVSQCVARGASWILLGTPAVSFQWENLLELVNGLDSRQSIYLGRALRWNLGNDKDLLLENPTNIHFAALSHGILLSSSLAETFSLEMPPNTMSFLHPTFIPPCDSFAYDDLRMAACFKSKFGIALKHNDKFGVPCDFISAPILTCRRIIAPAQTPDQQTLDSKLVILAGVDTFNAAVNFCNATSFFDAHVDVFIATEMDLPSLSHTRCAEIAVPGLGRGRLWAQRKVPLILSHFQDKNFDWLFMCDSDSMINVDAVLSMLSGVSLVQPLIYGQVFHGHGSQYPTGGACYVLNSPAVHRLVEAHENGAPGCVQGHQNLDVWLGSCARQIGISFYHLDGFFQHDIFSAVPFPYLVSPSFSSHRVCTPHNLSCVQHWEVANFFRLQNNAWLN